MKNAMVLAAACLLALVAGAGWAEENPVKAAHENLEPGERTDDLGITVPVPASHPGRRYPASHDFPSGPEIGERLPDFRLSNQNGEMIDYHENRSDSKSIVVFYRSAVW